MCVCVWSPGSHHAVFDVAEEVTKVYMEQVPRSGDHDVVVMAISYALIW